MRIDDQDNTINNPIAEGLASISQFAPPPFKPEECYSVIQGETITTNSKRSLPVLGTHGLYPCIGFAMYSAIDNSGMLAHIDESKMSDKLLGYIEQILKSGLYIYQIHIIGGYLEPDNGFSSHREDILATLEELGDRYPGRFTVTDLGHKDEDEFEPTSIALDTRTGQISTNLTPHSIGFDTKETIERVIFFTTSMFL